MTQLIWPELDRPDITSVIFEMYARQHGLDAALQWAVLSGRYDVVPEIDDSVVDSLGGNDDE